MVVCNPAAKTFKDTAKVDLLLCYTGRCPVLMKTPLQGFLLVSEFKFQTIIHFH